MPRRRRQRRQDARRTAELVAAFATVNAYERQRQRREDRRDDRERPDWDLTPRNDDRSDRRDERGPDFDYEPRFRWSRRRDRRDERGPDLTEQDIARAFEVNPRDIGLPDLEPINRAAAQNRRDREQRVRELVRQGLESLVRASNRARPPLSVRYNTDPQLTPLPELPELDHSGRPTRITAGYSDDDTNDVNATAVNLTINVMTMPGAPVPELHYEDDPEPTVVDAEPNGLHTHTYVVSSNQGRDEDGKFYEELTRRCTVCGKTTQFRSYAPDREDQFG